MDQLSLPYRIALVAILAVGALYLVVLKPSGDPAVAPVTPVAVTPAPASKPATPEGTGKPSAPGVTGLTSAVGKARGAATAQAGSDAATESAAATAGETTPGAVAPGSPVAIAPVSPSATAATTGTTAVAPTTSVATTTTTTTATPAKPAEPAGDPSAPLLAALDRGRTVVVLFAGRTAVDDLAVRRALRRADRRGGKVQVHVLPLSRVGDYEAITRGVQVQQSPTLLVIGKSRQAREIVGFTTTREIDQLVADVRRG